MLLPLPRAEIPRGSGDGSSSTAMSTDSSQPPTARPFIPGREVGPKEGAGAPRS